MLTIWGERIDPDRPLPEHPRPQLVRAGWVNLNGRWQRAVTDASQRARPTTWDGEIVVPFSPEAPLSGVGHTLQPDEALWYRRTFRLGGETVGAGRLLLHFGAVDQEAQVWVDGTLVGEHVGGFLPFTLDISDALRNVGDHELVVRCRDRTDTSWHARGKQRLAPGGIWYTPQSGIWQTVWLERVPSRWVERVDHTAHLTRGGEWELELTVHAGGRGAETAEIEVSAAGEVVARVDCPVGKPVRLPLPEARPWSPERPFLYDLEVRLEQDRVTTYAALRVVGTAHTSSGTRVLTLNGEPYLHAGLLDQGYWPDGLLTAPSDEALVADIEMAKRLGFTMLRKHIKIEPLRWYHHCDRLGMLVWQDMVNGGRSYHPAVITAPAVTPLRLDDSAHRLFGRQDAEGRAEFLAEVDATVELLRNTPSVVTWVPFNEGWGQFDAETVTDRIRALDPTRHVDSTSGWHDQGAGDMVSRHVYFRPYRLSERDRRDPRASVLSEYGGYSHRVEGHTWSTAEFGYRRIRDRGVFQRAYLRLQQHQVRPAIARGLAAFVYTQVSDVESETNGLITYDRRVLKVDEEAVRASNDGLRSEFAATYAGPRPVPVVEREITRPVSLTLASGHLNPEAVGFTRTPLVTTDGIGRGRVGKGRNKRWEYWAVTTPTHVVAVVVSDIDYAGVSGLWVLDRRSGTAINQDAITPFGAGVHLPGTLARGLTTLATKALKVQIEEVAGGTRIRARTERVEVDVLAERPDGHESLGVVVPWTERLFQYTVKDVARPAVGRIVVDGALHELPAGESWATLDHGRGRWPHRVHWNWGAGSGRTDGRVVGVQVGGRWTDGTGSVENSLLVDGRLHKISEELVWEYDVDQPMRPWRVHGETVDLTFTPEYDKHTVTDFKLISSRTHQCFGTWSGRVRIGSESDAAEWVRVANVFGWAEDVHQRW